MPTVDDPFIQLRLMREQLGTRLGQVETKLDTFREESRTRFAEVRRRLDRMIGAASDMRNRIERIERYLDYSAGVTLTKRPRSPLS